ncbi:HdeD family acid-resistance protein [Microbacterium aurum]
MTATRNTTSQSDRNRSLFLITGVVALVVGVLILVWPTKTGVATTAIIATYAVVMGLIEIGSGLLRRSETKWTRLGYAGFGLVLVALGAFIFANLRAAATWLAIFIGVAIGILWLIEAFVALSTLSAARSRSWTLVFIVVSAAAGIALLFSPLWGAFALWWLLAALLIVLGITNIARAFAPSSSTAPASATGHDAEQNPRNA